MSGAVVTSPDFNAIQSVEEESRAQFLDQSSRTRSADLASFITKTASSQTYWTVRLLVDPSLVNDAFRAYAYFRWVDDVLDQEDSEPGECIHFLERQQEIISQSYKGLRPSDLCAEEEMVFDLITQDPSLDSGLAIYIKEMMSVMAFDVQRKHTLISQAELEVYTRCLSTAVSEALHYFIGHGDPSRDSVWRYSAVRGAHITHILRDMIEDIAMGYHNIPQEYLQDNHISEVLTDDSAIRLWVISRVHQARICFAEGRKHLAQVKNWRCRLAGYAYIERFEIVLDAIERDGYILKETYPQRKNFSATVRVVYSAAVQTIKSTIDRSFFIPESYLDTEIA